MTAIRIAAATLALMALVIFAATVTMACALFGNFTARPVLMVGRTFRWAFSRR